MFGDAFKDDRVDEGDNWVDYDEDSGMESGEPAENSNMQNFVTAVNDKWPTGRRDSHLAGIWPDGQGYITAEDYYNFRDPQTGEKVIGKLADAYDPEPQWIDPELKALAQEFNIFIDWQDAGTLVLYDES